MAKLGSYYALCPLIDVKSLLGISEDVEKGVVIATLGKNISSRCKISDQKQLSCWRTKEKFSSPVIYDKNYSKYLAVFNHSFIKLWDTEENSDKVKKYKFNKKIYTLISDGEVTFVIFSNGAVYNLEQALQQRKILNPEGLDVEHIENVLYKKLNNRSCIGLIVKTDKYCFYWKMGNEENSNFSKINLMREGYSLRGYVLHSEKDKVNILTLWSDGSIFSRSLEDSNLDHNNIGDLFAVIESLSTKYSVSMVSLDEHYVAMYGADYNEEGAILIIYNTQFRVTQSRQPFKLFTDGAKLWCIENNLILPVGQNLAVVPFHLETEQLAALIGSHKVLQEELDADVKIVNELVVGMWDECYKLSETDVPELLKPKLSDFVDQGLPESVIVEEILPDILQKQDISRLSLILKSFLDIPEKYLAKILKFLLSLDNRYLNGNKCELLNLPATLQPLQRVNLIDNVLQKPFSDMLLLPHLRSELSLEDVLVLLNYIYLLCSEDGCILPSMTSIETEAKLIEWGCVLIDSSYQKIVLFSDDSVNEVLQHWNKLIQDHLSCLEELKIVVPLLQHFQRQKVVNRDMKLTNLRYSIEQLSLY